MNQIVDKIGELPLVYVRHKLDSTPELFQKWFDEGLVVAHYEKDLSNANKLSVDWRDYSSPGKEVMRRLSYYCESGALIAADYDGYGLKKFLLGKLLAGSEIRPMPEPHPKYKGVAYYKAVKLHDPLRLDYADECVRPLIVHQPRGGTVIRWTIGNIEKYVKYLYRSSLLGKDILSQYPLEDYPFTDYQWEVLCSEYLRKKAPEEIQIDHFLTPVGRTMKDIDIDGANKYTRIFAQVSLTRNRSVIEKKIETLLQVSKAYKTTQKKKNLVLLFFGLNVHKNYATNKYSGVRYVSTEEVLLNLSETGIIEDMLP